jgi:hypothetical protein
MGNKLIKHASILRLMALGAFGYHRPRPVAAGMRTIKGVSRINVPSRWHLKLHAIRRN